MPRQDSSEKGDRDRSRSRSPVKRPTEEAQSASAGPGGIGTVGNTSTELANRFVLVRAPFDNNRVIHLNGIKTVWHFCVDTFKHRWQTIVKAGSLNNWQELIQIAPNYSWDTGNLGMYMTDRLIQEIRRHVDNPTNGRNNVFVSNVKGCVMYTGLNAPFITGTTEQAATNSGVAAVSLVGKDLDKSNKVYYGNVTLDRSGGGLPVPTRLNIERQEWDTAGNLTSHSNPCDWKTFRQYRVPAIPGSLTETVGDFVSEGCDISHEWYNRIGCVSQAVQYNTTATQNVEFPPIADKMTEVDITESQGKLFEWDEKCDWLVDFQDGPFADFTRDVQISVDHASYARFPANPKATQQTIPEADEVITQPCHVHPEYQGYDPGQTAVDYTKTLWTRLIGKHGNYIDYESGKDSLKNIDSLPVFHFLPMNPPTTANADGQHVVCQLTMVNEIDITIKLDMRHPLPRLKNGSAFISINNSYDPRHVVTPIWANSGAKSSGSMINPPSHRWGSAPLEYV